MEPSLIRLATFNAYNLALPGQVTHGSQFLTPQEYDHKIEWIAGQLKLMDADVIAFQEVFHRKALEEALKASGLYPQAWIEVADETGNLPRVAMVSRFPIRGHKIVRDFPPGSVVTLEGSPIPFSSFQRPLIQAWVGLPNGLDVVVMAVHLKSKRPSVDPGRNRHDPMEDAQGAARALIQRSAEAVAVRSLVLDEIRGNNKPLILLGDLNDSTHSVTSDILMGKPPQKNYPYDIKEKLWDTLLYSTNDIQIRKSFKDVYYTHLHDSQYESLDHILVSQEFYSDNPNRVGTVEYMRVYNDHLLDSALSGQEPPVWSSDHGQVLVEIKLRNGGR